MQRHNINKITPAQPHWSISYWNAGKLLHVSVLLFVLESYFYGRMLQWALAGNHTIWIIVWASCFVFSFAHIFLVIADGWSRFQDYKRAKDQMFMYGPKIRILKQFAASQCQRVACATAAKELGLATEAQEYFSGLGYRWYHLLPDFMVHDPFFFYKRYFWRRTFLEKYYKPRFNYRELSIEVLST
jgi:hypothetical protein